ncbi:MAG: D-alanine--D-alanine ligase [Clostridia bacterium]|nr:D-alanine--D-alanine ligase [Clostridia bacterium]
MNKKTVLCMFGGKSTEHEVSLSSAYSILSNIDKEKYDVHTLGVTKNGSWLYYTGDYESIKDGSWHTHDTCPACLLPEPDLKSLLVRSSPEKLIRLDAIFPIMHGAHSEDGTLQGLFEISGIPYVGPGCLSSAVAMDKVFTKMVLNNFDIPQARFAYFPDFLIKSALDICIATIEKDFSYPVFVKPANAGSSIGTGKASDRASLADTLMHAAKFDTKIIVEEYLNGKEIEVAVMGNRDITVSACGEIDPGSEYYDYDTKYKNSTSSAYIPANIKNDTAEKIRALAGKIYTALGCRGLSRVDFFLCEDERIVFNEINTLPGFTSISMYPKLFMHAGLSYGEIIDRLITLACEDTK